MQVTVAAVIVPPLKAGIAYGHTEDGRCVRFTGDHASMVLLCEAVKARVASACDPVTVDVAQCEELEPLRACDCPAHNTTAA